MPRKNHSRKPSKTPYLAWSTPHIAPTLHMVCREKRRFPTEKQARYAADTQELTQPDLELDVYQCQQCRGWHLTRTDNKT